METGDLVLVMATGSSPVWLYDQYPVGQSVKTESVKQNSYCIVLEIDEIEGMFTQYIHVLTPRGQGFIRSSDLYDVG